MGSRWVAIVLGALVLAAGCGGGSSDSTVKTGSGLSSVELSGVALPAYSCSAKGDRTPVRVASSTVSEITLCPLEIPQKTSAPVVITSSDPILARLTKALSAPDQKPTGGMCAAYADLPQTVIAQSSSGPFLVRIPVDGCDHYLGAALSALSAVRSHG
jgi:hypothetical protein